VGIVLGFRFSIGPHLLGSAAFPGEHGEAGFRYGPPGEHAFLNEMPGSKLLMFGKPAVGAAVMLAAPLAALDIPLKVLVWEDRNGVVSVSYNSPGFLAERQP
jgi:hypothetical protein